MIESWGARSLMVDVAVAKLFALLLVRRARVKPSRTDQAPAQVASAPLVGMLMARMLVPGGARRQPAGSAR
jgi:hypothetical protein